MSTDAKVKTHAEAIQELEEATKKAQAAEVEAKKQQALAEKAGDKAAKAAADAAATAAEAKRIIAESQRKIQEATAEQRCACGTRRFVESFVIDAAGNLSDGGQATYECCGCKRVYKLVHDESGRARLESVVNVSSLAGWRTL